MDLDHLPPSLQSKQSKLRGKIKHTEHLLWFIPNFNDDYFTIGLVKTWKFGLKFTIERHKAETKEGCIT